MKNYILLLTVTFSLLSCRSDQKGPQNPPAMNKEDSFAYDYEVLKENTDVVLLEKDSMKVAVVGDYQARVMTSSANGLSGMSYGWINHKLIRSGEYQPHMHAFGGEERFWLGPEGGQFALFFKPGDPFDLEHWQTPGAIDTMKYELIARSSDQASYRKRFELTNYAGATFDIQVDRTIKILDQAAAENILDAHLDGLQWVGYQTENQITNAGASDWNKETGAPSIWLLGMMKASPANIVIIPYKPGGAERVNASYFGEVPPRRLIKTDSLLFFKGDAQYRSKIGIPPGIVQPIAGSYDASQQIMTIVHFEVPETTDYVNSMWEIQEFPYAGDVVNAYNDGPNEAGGQLGAFYELETSSPALALAAGESGRHVQRTFHFEGEPAQLDRLCRELFGIGLADIPQME